MFTKLLQQPPLSAERIAELVTQVLRRNEESRIYAWHKKTKSFPPRRWMEDRPKGTMDRASAARDRTGTARRSRQPRAGPS